jgi:hypothetical protein
LTTLWSFGTFLNGRLFRLSSDSLLKPGDSSRSAECGDPAGDPAASLANFEEVLEWNKQQVPQLAADAIAGLMATPTGQRPFRTVVDKLGMGTRSRATTAISPR